MSKSLSVTFRVPAELSDYFTEAVIAAGGDKTAWLVDAIRQKLNRPDINPDARLMSLVERMEVAAAALIVGKQGVPGLPYDEQAVVRIVAETIKQGFDNGRIISDRLNDAGCSGQQKLATALEFFQNNRSDSFGVKPPLY